MALLGRAGDTSSVRASALLAPAESRSETTCTAVWGSTACALYHSVKSTGLPVLPERSCGDRLTSTCSLPCSERDAAAQGLAGTALPCEPVLFQASYAAKAESRPQEHSEIDPPSPQCPLSSSYRGPRRAGQ